MTVADGLILENFPLAGAVQVRREAGVGDEENEARDREQEGRGRRRGLAELEAAQDHR